MGSGHFPDQGYGKSAYIRNMQYADASGNSQKYDGSRGIVVSDTNRYQMRADWKGEGSWGTYMYLGGRAGRGGGGGGGAWGGGECREGLVVYNDNVALGLDGSVYMGGAWEGGIPWVDWRWV